MGLCVSHRSAVVDLDASSMSYEDEDLNDEAIECMADESKVDDSMAVTGSEIVVTGPGTSKFNGYVGISQLAFTSDQALKLSKPLFASRGTTFYKSQATFFQRAVTVYAVPITEVTPKLFFGSFEDASNKEKLVELSITHIISLIGPKNKIKGMKHKHKPMSDYGRTDLNRVVTLLWPFIKESQKGRNKLFIHCKSGQNRSATVVLAILMKLKSEPNNLDELYRMLKKKRPVVQINEKYAKQLSEMERELFGETSVPEDWMSIASFDMNTGSVFFNDRGLSEELKCSSPESPLKKAGLESPSIQIISFTPRSDEEIFSVG